MITLKNTTVLERIIFSSIVLIFVGLLLNGCSYQPAINGFEKAALQNTEMANDNILSISTVAMCSLPYRTFLRHPETWGYINLMCIPGAKETTPNSLLKDTK